MVQYSLGLHFVTEFFLFSQNKTSDANIGIIAILVHFEKTLMQLLHFTHEVTI